MKKIPFLPTLFLLLLAACRPAVIPQPATSTPTASPDPTATFTATPTVVRTPPALPGAYQSPYLYEGDTPHTYIADTCQYLRDKWTSTNAAPGTTVMAIMFHAVTNEAVNNPNQISEYDFRQLMNALHDNGFQAITTGQLAGFLESNQAIPSRSVLLVADDRHQRTYFDVLFRRYWEQWGWPVVNAWISTDLSTADLWQQQVDLHNEGWVDYQAHGVIHNLPMGPDSPDEYILGELQGSIEKFQEHFGKTPIAIIWPGGGFGERPVELARQLGYRLGFTVNPRGPLMYNWVPLADELDPRRPSWLPEGGMGDPLLVLPRYWDTDAITHMDEVIDMAQQAAAYALQNRDVELEYYDIVCAPAKGPIP
jgi:hypothetical protein